jgi:hypothetical protein
MAVTKSITYSTASGNWSYVGANSSTKRSISIPVTTKIPEKAKITNITFTFLVRATSMGSAYTWYLNYFAIGAESNVHHMPRLKALQLVRKVMMLRMNEPLVEN